MCRFADWIKGVAAAMVCAAGIVSAARGGDWPQVLGPNRDGIAADETVRAWAGDGPKLEWKRDVGSGFAGVAVVGERAVLFHRQGNQLLAEALSVSDGKPLWKATFETNYQSGIASDDGPRIVPLIDRQRVYLAGPAGELACVALDSGKTVWSRNAYQEFAAPEGYFGAGCSPIVVDDTLLWNVGGKGAGGKPAGIVAFALADGKPVWQSTSELASYSSPVLATQAGVRHAIFVTRLSVVSLDPANGAERFRLAFGQRGPTVNAATPLVLGDHLFLSASYGVGARWVKFGTKSAEVEWDSDEIMSSQYTTCVSHGGLLYGIDGRQDVGVARMRCIDPGKEKVLWTEADFGTGNLIRAGDTLLVLKTDGTLVLVEPTPKAYRPVAKAQLFNNTVQALPALADGRLFARDTTTLKCFRVGQGGQ